MIKIFYATVALAALAAPANAQDGNWTGYYAGAELGAGFSRPGFDGPSSVGSSDFDNTAFIGGVYAGHDWQAGQFVYGGVANFDFLGFHDQNSSHIVTDPIFGGKTHSYNYDVTWVASARARAGFLASDQFLLYGTGGIAVARIAASSSTTGIFGGTDNVNTTKVGGAFGAGVEYAFASQWSLKTEYVHYLFSDVHVGGNGADQVTFKPSFGTLNFGISYHF
ncbi:outer membrane beta-barrel protein (plasmid) [Mesorhizobium sp. AR02]|uniref:outer membrane protein n=1 Tax=Mesorhizobium sp. AR02 TaxID=2865837 RepID=UPI00215FE251|nr:outer membrane beta-barrel protein [Mesorhizobium sp. AR02]UVK57582.1 outer membrane beta-barrel protein [Mesorhizobium sp. AR02]